MRVILFGYYGFGNAGDEAMLAGLLHGLRPLGRRRGVLGAFRKS